MNKLSHSQCQAWEEELMKKQKKAEFWQTIAIILMGLWIAFTLGIWVYMQDLTH